MQVTYIDRVERAPDVWEFFWSSAPGLEYVPGQYAHFRLSTQPLERARAFSLTSHPQDPDVRFITRLPQPASTYKTSLFALQPGDTAELDEPMGDCILPRNPTVPLVFVAQGIALASYLAMLAECRSRSLAHEITLLWARRSEVNRLENLIPGEITLLNRIDVQYPERLSVARILDHVQPASMLYLSGSQQFVESLGAQLEAAGIPRIRIIYDYYDGYTSL